jgi:transcriptional regulator with XRE-family HTH domain
VTNAQVKVRLADFGKQVRHFRLALGISQRELDRRSHVGYRFISELEIGKENPSLATILRLAEGLGCGLSDLFPRESAIQARTLCNPTQEAEGGEER